VQRAFSLSPIRAVDLIFQGATAIAFGLAVKELTK
jgi:uncharacterized membrane protein HdeD (DUF308 family)